VLSGLSAGETVLLAPPAGFTRELENAGAKAEEGKGGAESGAAATPAMAAGGESRPAREGARREGQETKGERGSVDPAKAEEYRKRFEGMSEEEKAKAMEEFRKRRGDGERGGEKRPSSGSAPGQ